MILVIGLGNPGKKFERTRHNVGFMAVDYLQSKVNNFSNWKLDKKPKALIANGQIVIVNGQKPEIVLAKPQTFMNLSGKAVKKLTHSLQLTTDKLWVIHDDIDIPLGKIRISVDQGSAGHKGVESIIKELGTKKFVRFRIGIQPKTAKPKNIEDFVLQKFNKKEENIIREIIEKTAEAVELAIREGVEKAMNLYNC